MNGTTLTDREERILEAIVRLYVRTAEPVGSGRMVDYFDLDLSPATVRSTMAELEARGCLYQPHRSAGRMPTDLAYRYYVDALMRPVRLTRAEQRRITKELRDKNTGGPFERLVKRAAVALGLVTGELGVAIAPRPGPTGDPLHLGRTSVLANQPEFADGQELKRLIELTERRQLLSEILGARERDRVPSITIGTEHADPDLSMFALVTVPYRVAGTEGVLGVIGPTRMPYDRVAAVVNRTGLLVSELVAAPGSAVEA